MVQIFSTILETALDSIGDPISGAQLFIYEAGTTTKLTTYSDSALTTPNTNPLIANSAGRFVTIYGDPDEYKFVLATAADTDPPTSPIQTTDDYVISAASSFSGGINPGGFTEHVINAQTATSYTVLDSDRAKIVTFNNANPVAVTLPQANSTTFIDGWYTILNNIGAGTVTITPTTSTLGGNASVTLLTNQSSMPISDEINYSNPLITLGGFTASARGSIAVQDDNDYGIEFLSAQGTSGQPMLSGGADALPTFGTLAITAGGTGQITALAAFNALKQDATESFSGVLEISTDVEAQAWTETDKALVPSNLAALDATSTQMLNESVVNRFVVPNVVQFNPGVAKVWLCVDTLGTQTILDSHNVTSIVDAGTGETTVNFAVTFANTGYSVGGITTIDSANNPGVLNENNIDATRTTSTFQLDTFETETGTAVDRNFVNMTIHGELS